MHEMITKYQVLTAKSSEEITNKINSFQDGKITSVSVTAIDHNSQGTGLRAADYMLIFVATIGYEFDITEDKIQKELYEFANDKAEKMARREKGNYGHGYSYQKDLFKNLFKEIISSEEYKTKENEIRLKYEKD